MKTENFGFESKEADRMANSGDSDLTGVFWSASALFFSIFGTFMTQRLVLMQCIRYPNTQRN